MVEKIRKADAVMAIVDGPDADSGTSWECGYAYALGKPVYLVRTDLRVAGDDPEFGINLMLSRSASGYVPHIEDDNPKAYAAAMAKIINGRDLGSH